MVPYAGKSTVTIMYTCVLCVCMGGSNTQQFSMNILELWVTTAY